MASFRKASQQEFQHQIKEIRAQLFDQTKCLEQRTDVQVAILGEINDFVRKKAELDLDYSKQMDKLVKSVMLKHKNEKIKRANWTVHATCQLWQQLVDDAKEEARQRSITADVCANYVAPAIAQRTMALQKIAKKCREIGVLAQSEVVRVLHELHTAMKTYQHCFSQFNALSGQLQQAEAQRNKVGSHSSTRKQRSAQKTYDKKSEKYASARLKCTRARNEYLLCIEAANASLHKFFADDISDLVDCTDLGMDWWLSLLLQNMITARKSACQVEMNALANLSSFKESLQSAADKQRFFESNHQAFMLPKRFDFKSDEAETVGQITVAEGLLADEFRQRHHQIRKRLTTLKAESEMSWQSMEEAERQIRDLLSACTVVRVSEFGIATTADDDDRRQCEGADAELAKAYDAYMQPFSYYLHTANLIMRLAARADGIGNALNSLPQHQQQQAVAASSSSSAADDHHHHQQQPSSPSRLTVCGTSISSVTGHFSESSKNGTVGPVSVASSSISTQKAEPMVDILSERSDSLEWAQRSRKKRIGSQASTELIHPPLANAAVCSGGPTVSSSVHLWRRPKLFGGSLEEYTEVTGEPIPLVVVSCIRILSQYALHHQGIFRISGSQVEINHMREAFESGEDPLREVRDANDANSIAGVLKLYLRELREPLFPFYLFDLLTDCAKCSSTADFITKIFPLLNKLPRATYLLLRYLFTFLNHLSELSDENMMDPYNLAICFGPTLLPIPEGKDQVHYQNSVNEVVKNLIVHSDAIFTARVPGPRYEKYASVESTDGGDGTPAGDISAELELFVDDEVSTSAAAHPSAVPPPLDNWPSSPASTLHQQPHQHKRLSSADLPFPPPSPQFHRFHAKLHGPSSTSSPPQQQQRLPFLANRQQQQQQGHISGQVNNGGFHGVRQQQQQQDNTNNSAKSKGNCSSSSTNAGTASLMNWSSPTMLCSGGGGASSPQSTSVGAAAAGGGAGQSLLTQMLCPVAGAVSDVHQHQHNYLASSNHVFNNNNTHCYSSTESGIADLPPAPNGVGGDTVATSPRPAAAAVQHHLQHQQFVRQQRLCFDGGAAPNASTGDDDDKLLENVSDLYASIHKDSPHQHQQQIDGLRTTAITAGGTSAAVQQAALHQQQQNVLKSPPPYNALYSSRMLASNATTTRRQSPPVALRDGGAKVAKMISPLSSTYIFPSPTRRRNSFHDGINTNNNNNASSAIVSSSVSATTHSHGHQHHRPSIALDGPLSSTTIGQPRGSGGGGDQLLKQQRQHQINAIDELLGKLSTAAVGGGDDQRQQKTENAMDK